MRPTNYLPKPALLLSTLTALSLYGVPVYAQRGGSDSDEDNSTEESDDSRTTAAPPPARTSNRNNDEETTEEPEETSEAPRRTSSSRREEPTTSARPPSSSSRAEETSSEEEESTSTEQSSDIPTSTEDLQTTLTSIAQATDGGPTGMPTLTRFKPIPTYPGPTVPPTNDAPFMQHSTAPQGTVFIAVGAILGAFGLAILLWRAIVGFLLHRSVERAARIQHHENAKAGFPPPPAPFYKYTDNGSNMSLSAGAGAGAGAARGVGVRRTNRGLTPSSNPSQSNLFFSPTAAASGTTPGNRGSSFLPSGFYAAGTSAPGGHEHSISLTNLRPDSRGFGNPSRHTLNPTPPDSPSFRGRRDVSSSTLNLNRPPSQRAPSAFLDDLLADDPSSLPPPQMPPSRHSGFSSSPSPLNRF